MTPSLSSGSIRVLSDATTGFATSDQSDCTPVGTSVTDNQPLAQLVGPHASSSSSDSDLVRIISAWPTLDFSIKHAILAIVEATS